MSETRRVIVQGVYELFEKERSTEWQQQTRLNRMVFIGIVLNEPRGKEIVILCSNNLSILQELI